jgi:hypothetical protein
MWWDFVDERIVGAPAKFGLVNCEYVEVMPVLEWILIDGLSTLGRGGVSYSYHVEGVGTFI